jgi:uracil-DNA glycosylase family 4
MNQGPLHWTEDLRNYLEYQVNQGFREVLLPASAKDRETNRGQGANSELGRHPLDAVRDELGNCTRCALHRKRRNIVFGEGNPRAAVMFIGEGPGADEDRQGRPFVGRAGQLLTKMIQAMTLDRNEVYIANIVKCRPPGNRDPKPEEITSCFPFLEAQISTIEPQVIVALGRIAAHVLLDTNESLKNLRGRFHDRKGIPVLPTFHPSFLLRSEEDRKWKGLAWLDLKQVMSFLNIPMPGAGDKP